MLLSNVATLFLAKAHVFAFLFFQGDASDAQVGWDPVSLIKQMGWMALVIVGILFIMSAWSIGVMIDRWIAFNAARKQSRQFAPAVAGALREGKLDEAIRVAERNKKSHLAKVVTAGLQEFKAHGESSEIPGEQIEASKRALERAEAIVHAELKRGLGAVAGGISEALVTTALGLFVAIPAVMMFNYFTGKVEAFDVEMDNSSSELVDYFLKKTGTRR